MISKVRQYFLTGSFVLLLVVSGIFVFSWDDFNNYFNSASVADVARDILERYKNPDSISDLSGEQRENFKLRLRGILVDIEQEIYDKNVASQQAGRSASLYSQQIRSSSGSILSQIQNNVTSNNRKIAELENLKNNSQNSYNVKVNRCKKLKGASKTKCNGQAKTLNKNVLRYGNDIALLQSQNVSLNQSLLAAQELSKQSNDLYILSDQYREQAESLTRLRIEIESNFSVLLSEDELSGPGCTDNMAYNYDGNANEDDGSCEYDPNKDPSDVDPTIYGCTDDSANNYDPNAMSDDGSCIYIMGCGDPGALNWDSSIGSVYSNRHDPESCRYSDESGCDLCSTNSTDPSRDFGSEHRFNAKVTWFGGSDDPVPTRDEKAAIKRDAKGNLVPMDDLDTDNDYFIAWPMTKGEEVLGIPHLARCFGEKPGTVDANVAINEAFEKEYEVNVCNYSSPTGAEICTVAEVVDRGPAEPDRLDMSKALMAFLQLKDGQNADLSVQIIPQEQFGGVCNPGFDN